MSEIKIIPKEGKDPMLVMPYRSRSLPHSLSKLFEGLLRNYSFPSVWVQGKTWNWLEVKKNCSVVFLGVAQAFDKV